MALTNNEKLAMSTAILRGDTFKKGDVLLFPLDPGEYCVQKMDGPVTGRNRIITRSWNEALLNFELLLDPPAESALHEYTVRIVMSELTIVAESRDRAEEIALEIYEGDARTHLDHSLCVECCEVVDEGPSDEDEETEV